MVLDWDKTFPFRSQNPQSISIPTQTPKTGSKVLCPVRLQADKLKGTRLRCTFQSVVAHRIGLGNCQHGTPLASLAPPQK